MKPIKYLLLASMASLMLASFHPTTPAIALSTTSTVDARIRLDWEVGTWRGRPVSQEYVYNDYLRAAHNVQLLVGTLDASGTVISRGVGFVRGVVPFNDRTYFEVPLKMPGASYRASVTALDWKDSGGGGGGGGGGM
jgi:hypothetical protein